MIKKFLYFIAVFILCFLSWLLGHQTRKVVIYPRQFKEVQAQVQVLNKKLYHARFAGKICDYLQTTSHRAKYEDVYNTMQATERFMDVWLEDTPFDFIKVLSIFMHESYFNPKAVSPVGARGVAQIMNWRRDVTEVDGVRDPFDINCSVNAGLKILRNKYKAFKTYEDAIVGYNSMMYRADGRVDYWYYREVVKCCEILKSLEPKEL